MAESTSEDVLNDQEKEEEERKKSTRPDSQISPGTEVRRPLRIVFKKRKVDDHGVETKKEDDVLSREEILRKRKEEEEEEEERKKSTRPDSHISPGTEERRRSLRIVFKKRKVDDHGVETKKEDDVLSRDEILRKERLLKRPTVDEDDYNDVLSREEILRKERLLKRPMVDEDDYNDYEAPTKMIATYGLSNAEILRRIELLNRGMMDVEDSEKGTNTTTKKKIMLIKNHGPNPPPVLPTVFKNLLHSLAQGKPFEEPVLVIQKALYPTDIRRNENRLSIPSGQIAHEFLKDKEKEFLKLRDEKNDKKVNQIEVGVIEPALIVGSLSLRRWTGNKDCDSYVLTGTNWNRIVSRYGLREGDILQVWAAQIDGNLWLALVLPTEEASTSGTKEEGSGGSERNPPSSDTEAHGEEEAAASAAAAAPSESEED